MKVLVFACALLLSLPFIGIINHDSFITEDKPIRISADTLPEYISTDSILPCGTSSIMEELMRADTAMQRRAEIINEEIYQMVTDPKQQNLTGAKVQYTLPIVVHIVTNNGVGEVSNQQIQQGIVRLNQGFANTGGYNRGSGTNMDIRFMLAIKDPNGQNTSGITRVSSPLTNLTEVGGAQDRALKNLRRWDPDCYINVWVVNYIEGAGGYATYPWWHNKDEDGIVVRASTFAGGTAEASILIHEFGHYLGLYHTFEGGCYNWDCNRDGDKVCDTPPDKVTTYSSCTQPYNSCSTDTQSGFLVDKYDMISNFMDYTRHACLHDFTAGQGARMRAFIQGSRSSLVDCESLVNPCANPPFVNIDLPSDSILAGVPLNITSTNESTIRVNWYINGESISTDEAFEYTFEEEGTYTLLLRGEGSSSFCSIVSDTRILTVYCPTQKLDYSTELVYSDVESPIELKVFPEGVSNWEWWLDGEPTGLTDSVERIYLLPGTYTLELKTPDGSALCGFVPPAPFELDVPCPGNLADIAADPDQVFVGDLAVVDLYSSNLEYIEWFVNGVSAGDPDPLEYTFTEPGRQEVVFFGKNPLEGCADYYDTVYIEVLCPFSSLDIQQPADSVEVGNTLTFPAEVANGTDVIWSVNGIPIPDTENNELAYTFTDAGFYEIVASANHAEAVCGTVADTVKVWSYCSNAPIAINIPAMSVKVGETFQLSADATGLSNLSWYIDGEKVGEGEVLDYSFFDPVEYEVRVTGEREGSGCAVASGILQMNAYCDLFGRIRMGEEPYTGRPLEMQVLLDVEWDSLQWRINGVPLAVKDTTFSYQFDEPGYYDVEVDVYYKGCIANIQLGTQYFTFVRERCQYEEVVGYWEWENIGFSTVLFDKDKEGNYYVIGDRRIAKLDEAYNTIWATEERLNFKGGVIDVIDGGIIAIAYDLTVGGFLVIKYTKDGELLWKQELKTSTNELIHRELKQLPTGELIHLGSTIGDLESLTVISKLSAEGDLIWSKISNNILGLDISYDDQGAIYLAGREWDDDTVILTKLNSEGGLIWSRLYLSADSSESSPLSFKKQMFITHLNNGKIALAFNQKIGEDIERPYMTMISQEGHLLWTKKISTPNTPYYDLVMNVEALPNGDMIFLSSTIESNSLTTASTNITRLSPNGQVIWHRYENTHSSGRSSGITYLDESRFALFGRRGGEPYTQILNQYGHPKTCGFRRGLIEERLIDFAASDFDAEIKVDVAVEIEPFLSPIPVVDFAGEPTTVNACNLPGRSSFNVAIALQRLFLCDDKMNLQAELCNTGNAASPVDLGLSFYDVNPLLKSATIITQTAVGREIPTNSCENITFEIPIPTNNIPHLFAFINDDGQRDTPFDLLDDPPNDKYAECNLFNNLDSIALGEAQSVNLPPIKLGEDRRLCTGEILSLIANPDYASFFWQDGTTEATYTVAEPGLYTLIATDACGKVSTDSVLVTAILPTPAPDLGPDFLYCEDRDILLRAGSDYESYRWQNGSTDSTLTVSQAGRYWVEVTDECGTSYADTIVIELEQFVPVNFGPDRQICEGETLSLNAGLGFATYYWTATTAIPCQDCEALNLNPTSDARYEVVTTLQSGCVFTDTIFIEVIASITHEEVRQICAGESTLIFGESQSEAGRYSKTFQSVQSCDSTVHIDLQLVEEVQASAMIEPSCFQQNTGEIALSIAGGLPPYKVDWEDGQTGISRSGLVEGSYAYTIQDDFGCTYVGQIEVPENEEILIDLDWEDPLCAGEASGSISVAAIEGELLYSLDGQAFQAMGHFDDLTSGDYTLFVKDEANCISTQNLTLEEPTPLQISLPSTLTLMQGDTLPIPLTGELERISQITWSPAQGLSCDDCLTPLAFPANDITYEATITDEQGCQTVYSIQVEVEVVLNTGAGNQVPGLNPPTAFSPNGDGQNDQFEILGLAKYPKASITIVDRWGKVVFAADPYQNDWDGTSLTGKRLPETTYYYMLDLKRAKGKPMTGNITLIR